MFQIRMSKLLILTGIIIVSLSIQPCVAEPGNPTRGKALYVGAAAFEKGGAPCLACHGIANIGNAGGANYGPDLSSLHADYGAEGVAAVLESLVFPSMEAIFAERPLTEQERLDLTAYFGQVSGQPPTALGTTLNGDVALTTVILFGFIALAGWRRMKGVRRSLVEQIRKQRGDMQ